MKIIHNFFLFLTTIEARKETKVKYPKNCFLN